MSEVQTLYDDGFALSLTSNEASPQTDEVYGRLRNILVDSA